MMKRKTYRVEVVFPFDPDTFVSCSRIVEQAAGKRSDGSGAGFGDRDMSFYCRTFKSAQTMASRIAEVLSRKRNWKYFTVSAICER